MLVLSRKAGEILHIGDDIQVQVVWIEGNRVRLAIVAPADIPIVRGELLKRNNQAENDDGGR